MTPEDIGDIFQELEDILFAMAIRNMDAHRAWEEQEGFKWTQWQAEQIKGLREYRKKVNIITNRGFNTAKKAIKEFLQEAYDGSVIDAAGLAVKAGKGSISPAFFGVNSQKMDILLEEAVKDIDTKRYAVVNRMNSGYTDFLRKADIFAQSGSMTIPQALDYAMKDFLSAGLNCVEYSNGNRVNIASYAEMALRTSSSEVTRQANGDVRDELDEYLVVSNVIGMTCPYCQRWQGRVLIDDVYADGKPDGKHQLVSQAKADHFLHPNCRHQLFMYIEGVTKVADLPNDVQTRERYDAEQKQRYYERQIRKYKRLRDGAVDPANRKKYDARVKEWTERHDKFLESRDYLRKNPKRLAPGYTGSGKPSAAPMMTDADIDAKVLELRNKQSAISGWGKKEDIIRDFGSIDAYFGADMADAKQQFIDTQNEIDKLLSQRSKPELVINGKTIGNPMTIDDALKGSNPNYGKGKEYQVNCQRCVQTYEYRRRGFDVEALPKKGYDPDVGWGNECFVDSNGVKPDFLVADVYSPKLMTEQAVRDELAKAPDGSRHVIYIQWAGKRSSHVFIAEKENGIVRFVDPQTGSNNVEEYFTRGRQGGYNMVRIDDKAFTDNINVINKVMK